MTNRVGRVGVADQATQASPGAAKASPPSGEYPSRVYRGWAITFEYGYFNATGPNYDASWEGEEDGWVDNGEFVTARTREGLIEEIDAWIEERAR